MEGQTEFMVAGDSSRLGHNLIVTFTPVLILELHHQFPVYPISPVLMKAYPFPPKAGRQSRYNLAFNGLRTDITERIIGRNTLPCG